MTISLLGRSPSSGHQTGLYCPDLTQPDQVSAVLEAIGREGGQMDGLVFFQRFRDQGNEWEGELRTSLTLTKVVIEQAVPYFAGDGLKSIVLISSIAARYISADMPCSYHVAKAGLCQMARYYACALGKHGIRVNAVCPGPFIKPENKAYYQSNCEETRRLTTASPLNRMGTCEDIANVILFLLSNGSSFVTGQSIMVDGGASLLLHRLGD
jgi:NAD(P)-dependent dehydrogenase (short-subunit alcohol dehydrogenase family)